MFTCKFGGKIYFAHNLKKLAIQLFPENAEKIWRANPDKVKRAFVNRGIAVYAKVV